MDESGSVEKIKVKRQILYLLKMNGQQPAANLALQLEVSPMAIRQHLQALQAEHKVMTLARIRTEEGYMAEAIQESSDVWLLSENHCSIATAAKTCSLFCRSEWEVFQGLLGCDVKIERVEHLLNGDRRCAYRISTKLCQ
ncbi:MAG: HTH domain-containing protein [Hydrococcus sp. Prado102]|jgi:predicted ArsR family transcriptional regulator|nr:HTH domain-containing protein [Hydrococcus sp. Prado102]